MATFEPFGDGELTRDRADECRGGSTAGGRQPQHTLGRFSGGQFSKELLERRRSLREAEIDLERKRGEAADLSRKALELELQLVLKRMERTPRLLSAAEKASFDQVVGDLQRRTLEAQRSQAAKAADVADREKKIVEHRLAILQAQQKIIGGR